MNNLSRRGFLMGGGAAFFVAGCRTDLVFGSHPNLRFGVISDIHLTTPASCALLERALEYYKDRKVDAVMICGDLTDWGLRSGYRYLKDTWDRVFEGTEVVPLFCSGNHDYEGWWYGDMTLEMHANGYSEREAIVKIGGMERVWQDCFNEKFAPIRLRTVKGYSFVSAEFQGADHLPQWLAEHAPELHGEKPFFFFRHMPISGTTADSGEEGKNKEPKEALKRFPNAVCFTGHTHHPFDDERSLWQSAFTTVAVPSLSYASVPRDFENGSGRRDGTAPQAMAMTPVRRDLRGGQGFVVSVYPGELTIERIDLEEGGIEGAPTWIVPLPASTIGPLALERRTLESVAPQFPKGASVRTETRNTENRRGKWTIVMDCRFPSAEAAKGSRVYSYEIRAVPTDGSAPLVKRFVPPSFARLAKYEPAEQRFWFDAAELPQDKPYVIEVRACNCFGKASEPIVSRLWRGKPGLATYEK